MVNVIGLGYIGLPTALMMASHGVEVIGTDYNKELVDTLNAGKTTFKEDGLDELFQKAVKAGIKFTAEYQNTDVYIVSVPTPYDKFSKKVDACYVVGAVKDIMKVCHKGATVVIESTVSPGTIDKFVRPVIEENGFIIGRDINLVHAPERIIPGNMQNIYTRMHITYFYNFINIHIIMTTNLCQLICESNIYCSKCIFYYLCHLCCSNVCYYNFSLAKRRI